MGNQGRTACGVVPGRLACIPDDFRASIQFSISDRSHATFLLVSAIRRGKSPRFSMLNMARSDRGTMDSNVLRLISVVIKITLIITEYNNHAIAGRLPCLMPPMNQSVL